MVAARKLWIAKDYNTLCWRIGETRAILSSGKREPREKTKEGLSEMVPLTNLLNHTLLSCRGSGSNNEDGTWYKQLWHFH